MSEELTPKACPHCGAERHPDPECGSFYSCNTVVRSPRERGRRCYERELNALRGELNAVRGELEEKNTLLNDVRESVKADESFGELVQKLFFDPLREAESERDQLRAWKDSALTVESEWDIQHLAKLCGATLGQSCRVAISRAVQEIPELRTTNAELLSALRGLLYEYDDREAQFGSDCFRQKHVDADTIDKARAAITRATEKPAQSES